MPAYITGKKTRKYSNEFKVSAVLLTYKPNKMIKDVAEDLDIHPFMLSRWRKEYREGKLVADKRRLSKLIAGINSSKSLSEKQRIQELEAENAELKLEIDLLKKVATISSGGAATRFRFIKRFHHRFGVTRLCQRLNVSRSGYYAWLKRMPSKRSQYDQFLKGRIDTLFKQNREVYGSPRIHQALLRQGICVARKRVERLMRELGLRGRVTRVYRRAPSIHRFFEGIKNTRKDLPKPIRINQHWAADLTYIKVKGQWVYLAVVLDLYSRRIVGWSMNKRRTVELTKASIMMALRNRRPPKGLVFHTDRGI